MEKDEKKIMTLTTASHGLVHLFEGVLPPLIPLVMAEFGSDYFTMGIIVSVFSYAFGLGSLPAGILADRIGPRRLVSLYLFGAGIAAICVFPARSIIFYAIIMGLIGAFCSTYHPASNTLISLGMREKGNAFGIHGIAGSIGVAVAPVISAMVGSALGWRAPHVLFGILAVGIGFFSLTLPRYPAPKKEKEPSKGRGKIKDEKVSISVLVYFFLSATALGLSYKGIMTFLPTYMGENLHFAFLKGGAVKTGGAFATVALLSGAMGQYIAGRLTDRFQVEKIYLVSIASGTLFVFIMAKATGIILVLAAVFYAFFYFSVQPVQNFMVSRFLPAHRQGLGYGTLFILTFGVGSTAAAVSGWLADHFGLQSVFYAMGFCFAASTAMAFMLMTKRRG